MNVIIAFFWGFSGLLGAFYLFGKTKSEPLNIKYIQLFYLCIVSFILGFSSYSHMFATLTVLPLILGAVIYVSKTIYNFTQKQPIMYSLYKFFSCFILLFIVATINPHSLGKAGYFFLIIAILAGIYILKNQSTSSNIATQNPPNESERHCNQQLSEYVDDHISTVANFEPLPIVEKETASLVAVNNSVNFFVESIPSEILNLLWFSDGNLKNYNKEYKTVSEIKNGNFTATLKISGIEEPSAISFELPIGTVLHSAPKLGYFPSYTNMTPDERATYLNWLTNIDTPIDIGYVFVFYYGLERLLYFDKNKYETAFYTILRLRKNHKHPSFLGYSSEALMGCAIVNKRDDLLKIALENSTETISPSKLACMAVLGEVLSTGDIISLSSAIGFTNKRYIKLQYDLFFKTLNHNLYNKYSAFGFPLTPNLLETHEKCNIPISANISIEERWIKVPNILLNITFQTELLEMLRKTHEDVKNILKQQRKGQK